MAASTEQPRGDLLGNAAALAVLAAAALEAKRIGTDRRPARQPDTATVADDVAAVAAQPGLKGKIDAFQAARPPLAFGAGVIRKFGDDRGGRLAALDLLLRLLLAVPGPAGPDDDPRLPARQQPRSRQADQ